MARFLVIACLTLAASCLSAAADEPREVYEIEISATVEEVWNAFTTPEGVRSWVAPLADVDFKVGGLWRANYNPDGELGDPTTIENTILAYDPLRMISLKTVTFPDGFPFVEAARRTWTIFYFLPVSTSRTRITVVGLGYTDSEQSQKMRAFFEEANAYSLEQLRQALTGKSRE